jgi:hypothetical protein
MHPSATDKSQISFLLPDLECQLDPRNALFRLARAMDWSVFEKEFRPPPIPEKMAGHQILPSGVRGFSGPTNFGAAGILC